MVRNEGCPIERNYLSQCMQDAFGRSHRIASLSNFHGGAQKTVFRVTCEDGFQFVLYIWDMANNYFQEEIQAASDHQESFGAELFENNNRFLLQQGIKTPALYYMNKERSVYANDFAFVEYIQGDYLSSYFTAERSVQDQIFIPFRDQLMRMHDSRRQLWGKAGRSAGGYSESCHTEIYENAIEQLRYASLYEDCLARNRMRLTRLLDGFAAALTPRSDYGFIHSELGPDHVLVNDKLEPYIIDIEGAMFFDVEHEHSFMEFRFDNYRHYLDRADLDEDRMRMYKLCHHLSLSAGGLKLMQRGFPNRLLAEEIMQSNVENSLRFLD
ncbi:phosphotransferase [Paenibacillus solisilvae]|uniref:Phosphotransferase n=1 Tax=Paenibacillus solisilvae TaxID=2486751 RepID=A0ABW0VW44_9BACL